MLESGSRAALQGSRPPQEYSFKLISEGKNVIITAPTSSGKTLAGFLAILSELFKLGEADIILMEDRKKRLLELHEAVMRRIGG